MRIDYEYMKRLLDAIQNYDHPDFRIDLPEILPLWKNGDDDKNKGKFVFHMEILEDQGFVKSSSERSPGLSFKRLNDGSIVFGAKPLRLTAEGHDFASALSKTGVLNQLKTAFKDAGPREAVKIALSMGAKAFEKKLDEYME